MKKIIILSAVAVIVGSCGLSPKEQVDVKENKLPTSSDTAVIHIHHD